MIYEFEDYELNTQCYELRRAGRLCKLQPKAFNVLLYLVTHCNMVISKQELLDQLWPNQHVGDATLAQRLMAVRKALGDDGEQQRFIKTVHGRGFRFVAEVQERTSPPGDALDPPALEPEVVASRPQGDEGDEASPVWELKPVAILAVALTMPASPAATCSHPTPWALAESWERRLAQHVATFGGVVLQRGTSLLTAAFGIPRALEQMPQRALHTARALHWLTLATEPEQPEPPVAIRCAMHAGTLLVHLQPPAAILHLHAVGDTLELPMRLVEQARAGELVLSSQVAHALETEQLLQEGEMVVDTVAPPRLHTHEARQLKKRGLDLYCLGKPTAPRFSAELLLEGFRAKNRQQVCGRLSRDIPMESQ